MRSYGQFCPVAKAAEIFCERWTALILRDLALGATRFSELQRGVPLASPSLLSRRLRQLVAEGVVERRRTPAGNSWTYHLTPAGNEFVPLVMQLGTWGQRWSRRDLTEGEQDVGLLMWALERGARPGAFGSQRAVIQFELPEQPPAKRFWWFLNEAPHCELCIDCPDTDIALFVEARLCTLIHVWRGDTQLGAALANEQIMLYGSRQAQRAFQSWLAISPLAGEAPQHGRDRQSRPG